MFAGNATQFSGNAAHSFRDTGPRPFVLLGIGVIRAKDESRFPVYAEFDPSFFNGARPPIIGHEVFSSVDTHTGWNAGGGVDIPIGDRWSLRPEARALFGAGSVLTRIDFGASVGYGW